MPDNHQLSPTPPEASRLECDYDANPTILYQAIEAKQWEYAMSLFTVKKQGDQSSTWVVRKETNGKLRWRLLPLHAAIIFGSPLKLIEFLLADYPSATLFKDDQGMLPLHLAFRNESSWDVTEELLHAYPQAVFVSDRKGRVPLEYGSRSISTVAGGASPSKSENIPFKSVVGVLELYTKIVVASERDRAQQEARQVVETGITKLQETHLMTLTKLKREWHTQREEMQQQLQRVQNEKHGLEVRLLQQEVHLQQARNAQADMTESMKKLKLSTHESKVNSNGSQGTSSQPDQHSMLRATVNQLVQEQKSYHEEFRKLFSKYNNLVEERQRLQNVFVQDSVSQQEKEMNTVSQFQSWLDDREKKFNGRLISSAAMPRKEEEKKGDEGFADGAFGPDRCPSTREEDIIDLSRVGSTSDD